MIKILFLAITVVHGFIHLIGFVKAFDIAKVSLLTQNISKPRGILWLLATILFIIVAILFLAKKEWWWIIGIFAVVLSQVLIILSWQDAKFGTIPNAIISLAIIIGISMFFFEQTYKQDVKYNFKHNNKLSTDIITEEDIKHLPDPVKEYLRYTGVIGKPKVKNMCVTFQGQMREKDKDYFTFVSEQYNFFDEPTRLFFMKGKMFGITVPGYHRYMNAKASMDIRLFGLVSIIKKTGEIMDKTETVTLFNDMCLLAPATLIDKRITWETIDEQNVSATFTNNGISISATLYFNSEGQLINFISYDRTAISDMKQYPFSTPVSDYKNIDGLNLITYGEAVWHYPDGEFTYGKFTLKEIKYNLEGIF